MTPVDRTRLVGLVRDCAGLLRRRSGLAAVIVALGTLLALLPVAWVVAGSDGWASGSPGPLLLLAIGGATALWAALLAWRRGTRWATDASVARQIESSCELPDGRVRAQLELSRATDGSGARGLALAGERSLLTRIGDGAERLVRDGHRDTGRVLRSALGLGVGLALLAAGLHATSPERARAAWAGLASPVKVLRPEPLPPLQIRPGDARVPRGDRVRVDIVAQGREAVTLHRRAPGALREDRSLVVRDERASASLPPLESSLQYWVSAPDGAVSDTFLLEPEDPLLVSRLQIELRFPPYLDRGSERYDGVPERLDVPVGSEVEVSGDVSGEATEVRLRRGDGAIEVRADVVEGSFRMNWRPSRSGALRWEVAPELPSGTRLPEPLRIERLPDAPPRVALDTEDGSRTIPGSLALPLRVEAVDDWGLDWIELEIVTEGASGWPDEPARDRTSAGGSREVALRPVLDVSGWGLRPGSRIRVRARAADLAPVPGTAESAELVLTLPDAAELRQGARDRVEAAGHELETLAERSRRAGEDLRARARAASSERSGASTGAGERDAGEFSEAEALRGAIEEQLSTAREIEALREELARARQSLGSDSRDDPLTRRLRELEELLDEIGADPDLSELQEAFDELGGQPGSGDRDPDPAELSARQDELRDRLEEAVERFRRAALEGEFEGASEEIQELAARQDSLSGRLQDGDPEAARDQEELAADADQASDRLDALEERLREAGEPEAAEGTRGVREQVQESIESMRAATERSERGDSEGAASAGDEAARALDEAREQMESARMEWLDAWEDQVRNALTRGAHDALSIAALQGALGRDLRAASGEGQDALLARQAVLIESTRNLASHLSAATRQAGGIGRELSESIGQVLAEAEAAAEALRSGATPRGTPFAAAQRAQEGLKRTAIVALASRERVGESAPPSDANQLAEDLSGMAGEQESMNQEAQSLSENPGAEGASARMEELAGAQEAMAGALGELAERFGGSTDEDPLGQMADEAAEIARLLDEGRLEAETLDRQASLLERLLEAGRSLERDGPTEEREGTRAGAVERPAVRDLANDLLRGSRIPLPSADALELLSPAERRLVSEYFDRLGRLGRPDR